MPCVGFEPKIPASERAKTVHGLDRSATVTGENNITATKWRRMQLTLNIASVDETKKYRIKGKILLGISRRRRKWENGI
jgi:hypothetical protein